LTRGPVHEAFAEPVNLQVQGGVVAPKQPPPSIEETPPTERPAGEQFFWAPGYWAWDGERNNYIWVSGCWRAAPPKMSWVPGYWSQVAGGWEWVPGFWAPSDAQQIEYLPAPPAYEDVQPPENPSSADKIWVPSCWYWYHGQYIRRPGYWLSASPGWIWVPSYYTWTPRGYIFVEGHWDYSLERRGVLFAPVYFSRPDFVRVGFFFSPSIVIDIGMLEVSLFAYPRYCHYYFGDYYDDAYIRIGIFPWFECARIHTWYDPIYEHHRWHYRRTEPRWEARVRHDYDIRRADKDLRPPRTYHEMETRQARLPEAKRRDIQMAQPLAKVVAGKAAPMKFEKVKTDAQQKFSRKATDVRNFGEERNRWESKTAGPKIAQPPTERKEPPAAQSDRKPTFVPPREVKLNQPEKVNIPTPPVVGRKGGLPIFSKGPPSQPADEHKGEAREAGRERGGRKRGK